MSALNVKNLQIMKKDAFLSKNTEGNTKQKCARTGNYEAAASLETSAVLLMVETNSRSKYSLMSSIKQSHASNTTKLDIALMARDASIYIERQCSPMSSVTLRKDVSNIILRSMTYSRKLTDSVVQMWN